MAPLLRYTRRMIIDPYQWYEVTIRDIASASKDTITLSLERPQNYRFKAGQYTIFRFKPQGRTIMRQYSFSSPPESTYIECTIQREPGGEASEWFFRGASPGDTIEISQAFGNFVWDRHGTRPILFIAGRVGIAPFMSMIRDHAGQKQHLRVLYSVYSQDQVCFESELAELHTKIVVTGKNERIDQSTIEPFVSDHPIVYICGSRRFVEGMQEHLASLGVPPSDVRRELFTL